MHTVDWLVIAGYFAILAIVVWWSSKRQNTTEDYFLAGRNVGWFAVGASLFASNIGSEHIVGLAGQGTTSGMAMAHWELHAWIMMMLGWVFVPFYYRSGVYTMPEYLERRFGPAMVSDPGREWAGNSPSDRAAAPGVQAACHFTQSRFRRPGVPD